MKNIISTQILEESLIDRVLISKFEPCGNVRNHLEIDRDNKAKFLNLLEK